MLVVRDIIIFSSRNNIMQFIRKQISFLHQQIHTEQ